MSQGALAINKLEISDLYKSGVTSEQATEQLQALLRPYKGSGEIVLVCHNIPFDQPFLFREFPWLKEWVSYRSVDTIGVALACVEAGLLPLERVKLEELTKFFGIPHAAHSAIEDCQAMVQVWYRMLNLMKGANNA